MNLSGPAISDELILCLRFPPCYYKDGEIVKVQEEYSVPQRSSQRNSMWEAQTKRWSCMILYRSTASQSHSKVPFHKTHEKKEGLGKLRERLERKEKYLA